MKNIKELLIELRACEEAVDWVGNRTPAKAIEECHRGDWLLWLAVALKLDRKSITKAAGLCANTVRHLMEDERSIKAVDEAIEFGVVSEETRRGAAVAAADAAVHYPADAGAAAAYYAAAGAADAGAVGTYIEEGNKLQIANICRKEIGKALLKSVNNELK